MFFLSTGALVIVPKLNFPTLFLTAWNNLELLNWNITHEEISLSAVQIYDYFIYSYWRNLYCLNIQFCFYFYKNSTLSSSWKMLRHSRSFECSWDNLNIIIFSYWDMRTENKKNRHLLMSVKVSFLQRLSQCRNFTH